MQQKNSPSSGIVVAALRGGSGKTLISIGIIAALKEHGKRVAPFKKGPDYIDAGWLALAAGQPCHNLDTFLISEKHILQSFFFHSRNSDILIIEGNRGLYDGMDIHGSTSTAELAKLLNAPVILCIDCTKSTRSMAAVVMGCLKFDPDLDIRGVVLNRVAGPRHEKIARKMHAGKQCIKGLYRAFREDTDLLPLHQKALLETRKKERVIADYIAAMTDRYAMKTYHEIYGLSL